MRKSEESFERFGKNDKVNGFKIKKIKNLWKNEN